MAKQPTSITRWGDVVTLEQDIVLGTVAVAEMEEVLGLPQRHSLIVVLPIGVTAYTGKLKTRLEVDIQGLSIVTTHPLPFWNLTWLIDGEGKTTKVYVRKLYPELLKKHKVGLDNIRNLRNKLVASPPTVT